MRAFRKVEKIDFEDTTIEVKELTAPQLEGVETFTNDWLIETSTGIDSQDLTIEAYAKIIETIIKINPAIFPKDEQKIEDKKKL